MVAYLRTEYLTQNNWDLSADTTSDIFNVEKHIIGSLHLVWSGFDATDATIEVEGSNDSVNWESLYDQPTVLDSSSGNFFVEFTELTPRYIRLKYTANTVTTGSGTIQVILKR